MTSPLLMILCYMFFIYLYLVVHYHAGVEGLMADESLTQWVTLHK